LFGFSLPAKAIAAAGLLVLLFCYMLHVTCYMIIGIDARMYGAAQCSGIGHYIEQLTKNLFEIDKKNQYVLFLREPVFSQFKEPTDRVKKIKVTPRWYSYGEQLLLPFQLMGHNLDLIHYPHFNSPILFAKKSVCTIHDLTPFQFDGHKMKSSWRKRAHRLVFGQTIKRARHILCVSDFTKDEIIRQFKINSNKLTTTHLGVDERFRLLEKNGIIESVKTKYKITAPFIFFIGAWRNHKNLEGLISAFEILKNKYKIPHQLVLGGQEFSEYPNIRQKINSSAFKNNIVTPGFIAPEDLPMIYNAADAFVLPSFAEGFGLIAIEAQACGCPVAASNISSLPEVLNDSALFFDPKNFNEMAEQIHSIISNNDLKNNLIAKGLENVKRFSWKKCAEATLEVYEREFSGQPASTRH
jgi:glycosyltransferase involved in cell wall biosynthesis